MQFDLNLGVEPLSPAEKPLVIEPFDERKAAYERFMNAREYNRTVHAIRRASFGKGLASPRHRG